MSLSVPIPDWETQVVTPEVGFIIHVDGDYRLKRDGEGNVIFPHVYIGTIAFVARNNELKFHAMGLGCTARPFSSLLQELLSISGAVDYIIIDKLENVIIVTDCEEAVELITGQRLIEETKLYEQASEVHRTALKYALKTILNNWKSLSDFVSIMWNEREANHVANSIACLELLNFKAFNNHKLQIRRLWEDVPKSIQRIITEEREENKVYLVKESRKLIIQRS